MCYMTKGEQKANALGTQGPKVQQVHHQSRFKVEATTAKSADGMAVVVKRLQKYGTEIWRREVWLSRRQQEGPDALPVIVPTSVVEYELDSCSC